MKTQLPEALRLANYLHQHYDLMPTCEPLLAASELRRLHAENEALKQKIAAAQPAAQGMDVVQAAKALCKHAAKVQNINFDDYWLIHAEEFKEEAQIVLDAAQAKQGGV